jgi:hypothetical protein
MLKPKKYQKIKRALTLLQEMKESKWTDKETFLKHMVAEWSLANNSVAAYLFCCEELAINLANGYQMFGQIETLTLQFILQI